MTSHIEHFKKKLEEEQALVKRELESVGHINPDNTSDWEPTSGNLNIDPAEEEERAGATTDFEDRSAVEFTLEKRFNEITAALERIAEGSYGICRVCNEPIEVERLEANYSADTCKAHMG
jgi:RNA polymerase-binding transcription factor DksA